MGAIGLYTRDPLRMHLDPVKAQGPLLKFVQRLQELDLPCLRSGKVVDASPWLGDIVWVKDSPAYHSKAFKAIGHGMPCVLLL